MLAFFVKPQMRFWWCSTGALEPVAFALDDVAAAPCGSVSLGASCK